MAEWVWEARARTGETKKGVMEADTVENVQSKLRSQNLNPVRVKKKAKQLRKQAAKLGNIGINSGSDLLTVKAKYLKERAARIEAAIDVVLANGPVTRDLGGDASTEQFTDAVIAAYTAA